MMGNIRDMRADWCALYSKRVQGLKPMELNAKHFIYRGDESKQLMAT